MAHRGLLEVEVKPPWPYRISRRVGGDGVARVRGGVLTRLLHLDETAVVVHCWQPAAKAVRLRAVGAGPEPASTETLEQAIARMRFALGVDDDLSEFYATFRSDPLVGPAVRRRPWQRPRRRPWPWEALAWAITEQLIQVSRAAEIQRRMVRRWGRKLEPGSGDLAVWRGPGPLRDVPTADAIAARGAAELAAIDLAPARSLALIKCAHEVERGRADLFDRSSDARLLRISEIGPWTVQCLGHFGRGDPDSLPAGDLAYVKLVGYLAGLGRRASTEEVEEYFAPYAPFRALAGSFALSHWGRAMGSGPPAPSYSEDLAA